MGYQESFLYIEPQWKFEKLIRTYEKTEQPVTIGWLAQSRVL